jgi:hypothetical protein
MVLFFFSLSLEDNVTSLLEGKVVYQLTIDALSASWKYEAGDSPIMAAMYSFGTYPGGRDIQSMLNIDKISGTASVPAGNITPKRNGQANILEVYAVNEVGLVGSVTSASIVVDNTAPVCGRVICPTTIQVSVY